MNEKDKKLIEDIKLWEIPEEKKKHAIAFIRKDRRQKERFMRLPKEERLKILCKLYIGYAFAHGYMFGHLAGERKSKKLTRNENLISDSKRLKVGLLSELKGAKVLPLGK